jgi:N-acetyltransferase 10
MKLSQAELVAIDEAAAIPLPIVKNLLGPYIVFLSSTINGYEGTGRALSLKLIQQLRTQQGVAMVQAAKEATQSVIGAKSKKGERQVHEERWKVAAQAAATYNSNNNSNARTLTELTLETPIRYSVEDPIEKWLNNLLCLDMTTYSTRLVHVMPAPKDCDLYMVNRDALFSYHALSEALLQRIWALYTSAHYKNSPNDLQMLSDAPAHRLFVLLGPQKTSNSDNNKPILPDILCVAQIAFEGFISRQSIQSEILKGNKASGDLIPWTISQQFNDSEFATLSGARIVRIATHPGMHIYFTILLVLLYLIKLYIPLFLILIHLFIRCSKDGLRLPCNRFIGIIFPR